MNVAARDDLDVHEQAALADLVARRAAADGHPALPEPQRSAVEHGTLSQSSMRVLLAYDGGSLRASGFLSPATDGSHSLHLVLDPTLRPGSETEAIRDALIDGALAQSEGGGTVRLWSMRANEADAAAAARHGFSPERELVQMRVVLPLPPEVVAGARPVTTRPFERGLDEDHWLDVNNRAFAGHPEQGNWTRAELEERLSADWVDLNGFLVADDPEGDGIIGSCWTKIHRHNNPVLGEIYVISVDPRRHSQGWGKALTVAGLVWLADQGITTGMLYTDRDNGTAVELYRSLGFSVDHVDAAYVHTS